MEPYEKAYYDYQTQARRAIALKKVIFRLAAFPNNHYPIQLLAFDS